MEAVIFIGVQGSGKSTFYRERFFDTHLRINLDTLRTRRRESLILQACLAAGQRFVVDNTNSLRTDRVRYIGPSRAAGFRVVAYFFRVSLQDAIQRNNRRLSRQRVPGAAVASTFKKLQEPTLDEGFDKIYTVELTAEDHFAVTAGPGTLDDATPADAG
jgi:predicted kinase